MPQKPFNLGTDPRGVFKGQGLYGQAGRAIKNVVGALPQQPPTLEQLIGSNLIKGDYNPLRGIRGGLEDYNRALTGTGSEGERVPGFERALTLALPGGGGGPAGVVGSGILRIPRPFIGTLMNVLKNPTVKQAKEFMKKTRQNEIRTIIDYDTRNMYVFDAWEGAHSSIGKVLGLDLSKIKWGASMQNSNTQVDSLFNRFKK